MILMIFAISSLTAVSATDIENNTVYENKYNNVDVIEGECCSFVIQEENNETIFSFRQDSVVTPTSAGLRIETQDVQGHSLVKQRVDSNERYFAHALILDNGWYKRYSRFLQQSRN